MAADSKNYILNFDVEELTRNMAELQAAYEVFSDGFKEVSEDFDLSLASLENKVVHISNTLDSSYSRLNSFYSNFHDKLKETSGIFSEIDENAKSLNSQLSQLGGFDLSKPSAGEPQPNAVNLPEGAPQASQADNFSFSITGTGKNIEELEKALATAEAVSRSAKKAIEESKKSERTWKSSAKRIGGYLVKEVNNAKSRITSMVSSFSMGALGFGALGMIGAMVLGVKEKQRRGAERGEVANVMEAAGGMFEKTAQQGINWASRFQEVAQFKYGIGRKEIQSVFDTIVKGGHASEYSMSKFNKKVSDVNANILSQSVAMDKAFNLATGTTINRAVQYVEAFGGSIDSALDKLRDLSYEAQTSGMSMDKFVNAVTAGSSSLMQYRVDMSEVASVMRGIKKSYEDMGLDEAQAGALAAKATEGLTGLLGRMPEATRQAFAIQYYGKRGMDLRGKGYEAEVRLGEEFSKAGDSGEGVDSSKIFLEVIKFVNEEAGAISRDYYGKSAVMQKMFGMDTAQSQAAIKLYEKNITDEGLKPMTDDQIKQFKETFNIEGSQLTQLQRNQRDLINGLSKVGEGLLSISANILATIVLGIRTIPSLVRNAATIINPASSKEDRNQAMNALSKIGDIQSDFFRGVAKGVDSTVEGFTQVAGALGDTLDIIDSTRNIRKAATADIGKTTWTGVGQVVKQNASAIARLFDSSTAQEQLLTSLKSNVFQLSNEVTHLMGIISDKEYEQQTAQNEQEFIQETRSTQVEAAKSALAKNREIFRGTERGNAKGSVGGERSGRGIRTQISGKDIFKSVLMNQPAGMAK